MSGKKYAVVNFTESDTVEVIPTKWLLGKGVAKWPSKLPTCKITKYLQDNLPADDQWENFKVKVLCSSNCFKSAHIKAQEAQETSNLESSASEDETTNTKRKRQIPVRFRQDSSTDDDLENFSNSKKSRKKRFKAHTPPSLSWAPSIPINLDEVPQTSSEVPEMFPAMPELNNLYPETSVAVPVPEIIGVVGANAASLFGMMKRLFCELERLRLEMKKLAQEHARMNATLVGLQIDAGKKVASPITSNPIPNLDLPIQTDEDLVCLNQKLSEDTKLSSILVSYLSNICYGKQLSFFTTNLLKKFIAKDVALQYSRLGRKGKKSLEDLREIYHVLLATMSLHFPEAKREELSERLGKVLSCAREWGYSTKRSSLVEFNDLSNSLHVSDSL
ncbi:uncharacterized protein [Parasteatoda tepidariorum]|uniref:uncharacterized protein n=1 Tax=Parasteatoda tepidariorum TaxID=114398 RepID=UPI001C71C8E6|nr:uncharacterized protein LOC107450010 [Parasteatoda tepidariorum]